jgi:predicted deacylase
MSGSDMGNAVLTKNVSLIQTSIDFEADGLQRGVLRLPYSHNRSAYGHIPIPILVIKNGTGPTLLLTGANHGDEYEGPIALADIASEIDIAKVNGRIIVIPALNIPAYVAGTRTSPIDSGNLNRAFPGRRDGTPTEILAHYIDTVLFELADYAFDSHSGGASLDYLPILFAPRNKDPQNAHSNEALVDAFAAPLVMYTEGFDDERMMSVAAAKKNVFFLFGEFGGGASASPLGVNIVKDGVRGLLDQLGIVKRGPANDSETTVSRRLRFSAESMYVFAHKEGVFVRSFELGDSIRSGDVAGKIYDIHDPWRAPEQVVFRSDGLAICVRTLARVQAGDCLAHLAADE